MNVLVTGAYGLLGTEVAAEARARSFDVSALGRTDLDVTDPAAVDARIEAERPGVIVHCAAYTAVDAAEREPDLAMRVNRDGAHHVAAAAASMGARMVYMSTDYVFDGAKRIPYLPTDPVAPLSAYGRTKLAGERAVLEALPGALVVRTGWLYGAGGRNFVRTILERAQRGDSLRVVDDQIGRPTWSRNLAAAVLDLIEAEVNGVWHVADRGQCSWAELAREAIRLRGLVAPVDDVAAETWAAAAPRPAYSVLDLSATEGVLGRAMMKWKEALARFLGDEQT